MKLLFKDKRGSIIDPIIWVISAFIVVVFLALLVFLFMKIDNAFNQINIVNSQINTTEIIDRTMDVAYNSAETNLKWISYMILIAMVISIFVHNALIKVNKAFIFLYLLLGLCAVLIAVPISNAYESLLSKGEIGTMLQSFTASTYIMLYLPIWAIVLGLVGLIFLVIGIARNEGDGSLNTDSSLI